MHRLATLALLLMLSWSRVHIARAGVCDKSAWTQRLFFVEGHDSAQKHVAVSGAFDFDDASAYNASSTTGGVTEWTPARLCHRLALLPHTGVQFHTDGNVGEGARDYRCPVRTSTNATYLSPAADCLDTSVCGGALPTTVSKVDYKDIAAQWATCQLASGKFARGKDSLCAEDTCRRVELSDSVWSAYYDDKGEPIVFNGAGGNKTDTSFVTSPCKLWSLKRKAADFSPEPTVDARIVCRTDWDTMGWYNGHQAVTVSGRQCLRWDLHGARHDIAAGHFANVLHTSGSDPLNNNADWSLSAHENYCRNIDQWEGGPWCLVSPPSGTPRREPCFPLCPSALGAGRAAALRVKSERTVQQCVAFAALTDPSYVAEAGDTDSGCKDDCGKQTIEQAFDAFWKVYSESAADYAPYKRSRRTKDVLLSGRQELLFAAKSHASTSAGTRRHRCDTEQYGDVELEPDQLQAGWFASAGRADMLRKATGDAAAIHFTPLSRGRDDYSVPDWATGKMRRQPLGDMLSHPAVLATVEGHSSIRPLMGYHPFDFPYLPRIGYDFDSVHGREPACYQYGPLGHLFGAWTYVRPYGRSEDIDWRQYVMQVNDRSSLIGRADAFCGNRCLRRQWHIDHCEFVCLVAPCYSSCEHDALDCWDTKWTVADRKKTLARHETSYGHYFGSRTVDKDGRKCLYWNEAIRQFEAVKPAKPGNMTVPPTSALHRLSRLLDLYGERWWLLAAWRNRFQLFRAYTRRCLLLDFFTEARGPVCIVQSEDKGAPAGLELADCYEPCAADHPETFSHTAAPFGDAGVRHMVNETMALYGGDKGALKSFKGVEPADLFAMFARGDWHSALERAGRPTTSSTQRATTTKAKRRLDRPPRTLHTSWPLWPSVLCAAVLAVQLIAVAAICCHAAMSKAGNERRRRLEMMHAEEGRKKRR